MIKYLLKYDLYNLLKNKRKHLLLYFITTLIFFIYCYYINLNNFRSIYYSVLGLNFDINGNILSTVMFFIHFFTFINIEIYFFSGDLKHGSCSFLLRTNIKNWIIARRISTTIITVFIKIILHFIIVVLSYLLFKETFFIQEIFNCIFIDCIYYIVIQESVFSMYLILASFNKWLIIFFLVEIKLLSLNIMSLINYKFYLIVLIIVIQTLNYLMFRKNYIKVFEKETL